MFHSIEDVLGFIESNEISIIDLRYIDLIGRWHHISLPASGAVDLFENGVPFDSSSIPGFRNVDCGDMNLVPIISTGFPDPYCELPTFAFICKIVESDNGDGVSADPRSLLERAVDLLKKKHDADSLWLPELEFYLFDSANYGTGKAFGFFDFESGESTPEESGFVHPPTGGYHSSMPMDKGAELRSEVVKTAEDLGIPIRYHHHEVGAFGQQEIEMLLAPPLIAADNVMRLKHLIRMAAFRRGMVATFMPMPLFGEPGSGMHFHQFLTRDSKSLFWDADGSYSHMSKMGLSYIAGILEHAPSLVGITNPSTNSYRRLKSGIEAPTKRFFGLADRSASVRIPKYDDNPNLKRFEFRPPDATCNPYLAIAAQLLAGLDGIDRDLDPTKMGFGPFDNDVHRLQEKKERLENIPTNLEEALTALDSDKGYLVSDGVFDDEIIARHIKLARIRAADVAMYPSPREIELYFDI